MSAEILSKPPTDLKNSLLIGASTALATTVVSPMQTSKIRFEFLSDPKIFGRLHYDFPPKPLEVIKKALPKCTARNMPFFAAYPLIHKQVDQHFSLSPTSSELATAAISGFAQNSLFNSNLKPSISKGTSGSVYWGSFFGITSTLAQIDQSEPTALKTASFGALAGGIATSAQNYFNNFMKNPSLSALLPRSTVLKPVRGSVAGAALLTAMTFANRIFGIKSDENAPFHK